MPFQQALERIVIAKKILNNLIQLEQLLPKLSKLDEENLINDRNSLSKNYNDENLSDADVFESNIKIFERIMNNPNLTGLSPK